jgi:NADP-dependent 3-hydroxy acid dehydrogenase YdfG
MNTQQLIKLDGKVAIVTGASGGFGVAIATTLASAGAQLALVGRDRRKMRRLADQLDDRTLIVEGDVSRPGEGDRIVEVVVDSQGRLDILVNTAGGATVGGLMALSDEIWQADIDLKLLGYMRMMRAAAKAMQAQGGGKTSTSSAWPGTSRTTCSPLQAW